MDEGLREWSGSRKENSRKMRVRSTRQISTNGANPSGISPRPSHPSLLSSSRPHRLDLVPTRAARPRHPRPRGEARPQWLALAAAEPLARMRTSFRHRPSSSSSRRPAAAELQARTRTSFSCRLSSLSSRRPAAAELQARMRTTFRRCPSLPADAAGGRRKEEMERERRMTCGTH